MIQGVFLAASAGADHGHALLHGASPLLLVAVLLIIGLIAGDFASRFHFPALTGQIIAGIVIGHSVLGLLGPEEEHTLAPLSNFAISLIAVTVGAHLNFRRLHNSYQRIVGIALVESILASVCVFFALEYFNPFNLDNEAVRLAAHLVVASIASATSPASALHVIKEKKAKGLLVKTMVAVIAIDNMVCLALFEAARGFAKSKLSNQSLSAVLLPGLVSCLVAIAIGASVGYVLSKYGHKLRNKLMGGQNREKLHATFFSLMFLSIGLAHGVCEYLQTISADQTFKIAPSPLLANMVLGLVLANMATFKDDILAQFDTLEQAVFACFFTIAGLHLDVSTINGSLLFAAAVYLAAMAGGKFLGATISAFLSKTTKQVSKFIGSVLLVQAGMSIALLIVIGQEPAFAAFSQQVVSTLLVCVVATELGGTLLIAKSLEKSGEADKDRTRLIGFLEEEYILPNLYAKDDLDAIEELCHFMVNTHKMELNADELYEKVVEREKQMPTGVGEGVAVPHAVIEVEDDTIPIRGVLALANPPVDFGAPDNKPARLIVLIITPKSQRDRHIEVIAAMMKLVSNKEIREALMSANSSAEAYEIIHSQEAESFNYFLT